jgi:acid stress-induced BolA-like protein IbaG/YrbA
VDAVKVKALVEGHLQGCEAIVDGEGNKYDIAVIGEVFEGLRPVKKQQLVYGALGDQIADGSIHAVNIATFTPQQWQAQK